MATIWISVVLLLFVKNAAAAYNPGICSILEESFGLIPPALPTNFEMKYELVDHLKNFTAYEEIYFDYTNSRAKYKLLLNTTEYHHLFDYDTQQVVEWIRVHPGVSMTKDPLSLTCTATSMEESSVSFVFGYQDWIYDRPKMFNSNQMLRFGGQYQYAANGSEKLDERDLKVNKFIGCIYDSSVNATMFNEYYFADTDSVQPSGGTPASLVTGAEDKPLSVPVKLHVAGSSIAGKNLIPFNRTISISWFKGEPVFEPETFQIPPWVHCKDYRGRKEIPKLPPAFSTRLALTTYLVDTLGELVEQGSSESYEEIYYDSVKKLARRDYTPNPFLDTEIFSKFGSYTPVSTIYDFNEGLMYGINKASGRCFIRPILAGDYFHSQEELVYTTIAKPEEIFFMQMDDMEYKGKAFARDVECNVWNGKHYHKNYDVTLIKETFYSADGWHEISDGLVQYTFPVKHIMIKPNLDGDLSEGVTAYNFLKFKGISPRLVSFDIKNCVEQIDHKRFAIELVNSNQDEFFKYKFDLLEAAQLYIANKTGVNTPLRVQRLHLRVLSVNNPRLFLVFSLLSKANLKDLQIAVGQKGKSLDQAIVLLQQLVEDGKFAFQFSDPKTKQVIPVAAEQPTLYTLTASGDLTQAPKFGEISDENSEIALSDSSSKDEHSGMTGGHLALLAFAMLFIGVAIGIAIMYLYLRIYSERIVEDRINMQTKSSSADTP